MKNINKFIIIITSILFFHGCVQNTVFLGPSITVATTGNLSQGVLSLATNSIIKKKTGKDAIDHVSTLIDPSTKEEKTPNQKFVEFIENHVKKSRLLIKNKKL